MKCHYIHLKGHFSEGLIVRFIIRQWKLINVVTLWNKLWSFIKQFIQIGLIENFKFFLQTQLAFLGNIWTDWYRFDYGLSHWWHNAERLPYFPNILLGFPSTEATHLCTIFSALLLPSKGHSCFFLQLHGRVFFIDLSISFLLRDLMMLATFWM